MRNLIPIIRGIICHLHRIVIFVFVLNHCSFTDAIISRCDLAKSEKYINEIRFDTWCYFVVKNVTNETHRKVHSRGYSFNVTRAREICKSEKATLPIIRNEKENALINKHFKQVVGEYDTSQIVLGLQQYRSDKTNQFEYKWDDGTNFTYKAMRWIGETQPSLFTVISISHGWKNVENVISQTVIGVVCQQAASSPIKSPCDSKNSSLYAQTLILRNETCIFEITGATAECSQRINKTQNYFLTNITKAREICDHYGATLPVITDSEKNIAYAQKFQLLSTEFGLRLALGLKQEMVPDGYAYKWDNGMELDFEAQWVDKYAAASITTMVQEHHTDPITWINEASLGNSFQVLVMCEKPYRGLKPSNPLPAITLDVCNYENKSIYFNTKVFRQFCYFLVNESVAFANTKSMFLEEPRFKFDIFKARSVCKLAGATLVTIDSEEEFQFINTTFPFGSFEKLKDVEIGSIALDLKQGKNVKDYFWADGSTVVYEPLQWHYKNTYAWFTVMHVNDAVWQSYDTERIEKPVGILRKSLFTPLPSTFVTSSDALVTVPTKSSMATLKPGSTISPNLPNKNESATTFPPPTSNKCLPKNQLYYTKTAVFGDNELCYFVVPNFSKIARPKYFGRFSIGNARKVCRDHGATLPIILRAEEAEFIMNTFDQKDYDPLSEMGPFAGVALGLTLDKKWTRDGYSIVEQKWDDKSPMHYAPDNWNLIVQAATEDEAAVFMRRGTGLSKHGQISWMPMKVPSELNIAVLCQHDIRGRIFKEN